MSCSCRDDISRFMIYRFGDMSQERYCHDSARSSRYRYDDILQERDIEGKRQFLAKLGGLRKPRRQRQHERR